MIVLVLVCALVAGLAALRIAAPYAQRELGRGGALAAMGLVVVVFWGAMSVYLVNGQPEAPGAPHAEVVARLAGIDPVLLTPLELEERLRANLRENPDNVEALTLLGRFLSHTGRELEAVSLFEQALWLRRDPRVLSDLGQSLVVLNQGQVTQEAERAFTAAYGLDPSMPEPAFFLGTAYYERGDRRQAAKIWSDIIGRLNEDDPFRSAIVARAVDMLSRPPGGSDDVALEDIEESMVDVLQTHLEKDPGDLSGWLVLARVRMVRGETEAGLHTLGQARMRFDKDAGALALIDAMQITVKVRENDA